MFSRIANKCNLFRLFNFHYINITFLKPLQCPMTQPTRVITLIIVPIRIDLAVCKKWTALFDMLRLRLHSAHAYVTSSFAAHCIYHGSCEYLHNLRHSCSRICVYNIHARELHLHKPADTKLYSMMCTLWIIVFRPAQNVE